jgi:hypothetical protein
MVFKNGKATPRDAPSKGARAGQGVRHESHGADADRCEECAEARAAAAKAKRVAGSNLTGSSYENIDLVGGSGRSGIGRMRRSAMSTVWQRIRATAQEAHRMQASNALVAQTRKLHNVRLGTFKR